MTIRRDEVWNSVEPLVAKDGALRAASLSAALLDIPNLQAAWIPQRAFIGASATAVQPDLLAGHDLSLVNLPYIGLQQAGRMSEVAYWLLASASSMCLNRASETALALTANFSWGAWVYINTIQNSGIMGKGSTAYGNRCWQIYMSGTPYLQATIFDAGGTEYQVLSTITPVISTWYFVQAKFVASTELSIFVNATKNSLLAGLPAATRTNAVEFAIGKLDNTYYLNGRVGAAHSASALSDQSMLTIYQRTKGFYGV